MKRIAITGGPCAGKTTGLAYLTEKLSDRGFLPLIVPEAATLLMLGNLSPTGGFFDEETFQTGVVASAHALESVFSKAAKSSSHKKVVLLFDRGIPDALAYMKPALYEKILLNLGLGSTVEVRDGRYDAAIHLVTAAEGAEEFYSNATNAVRRETPAQAREKDRQTQRCWIGHPHLRVVGNASGGFEEKLRHLDKYACQVLGIPVPLEIERKFLCSAVDLERIPVAYQRIQIEQVYLQSPGPNTVLRVRKRGLGKHFVYFRTVKHDISRAKRHETEEIITAEQYLWSLQFQLPGTRAIKKERICFVWENQYFELDIIQQKKEPLYLLEIELTEENESVALPDFIRIQKEVTDDPRYANRALANVA